MTARMKRACSWSGWVGTGGHVILKVKTWSKGRPTLDIDVSATWFLLFFVYTSGLSINDRWFDFHWSGIVPVIKIPTLNIIAALLCLVISIVVLVEPALPSKLREWTNAARNSTQWHVIFRVNLLVAFMFGLVAGLVALIKNLPEYPLAIQLIAYVGFGIFLLMAVKGILRQKNEQKTTKFE